MTPPTAPSVPHAQPATQIASLIATQPPTQPAAPAIAELVARLDGLEQHPLPAQVEVLDAVRRGLDQALSPAVDQR